MKTLNEEVKAIKAANNSINAKKAALAKLGITPYEIEIILSDVDTPVKGRFTFGVEIECFVPRGAIRTAAETTGMAYEYEGYNHNDGHAHFKFVTDASLHGLNDPIECVSPVLAGADGKSKLKKACETLNMAQAAVNRTCGLHVHIGVKSMQNQHFCNVFNNYALLEELINSSMAPSRRNNHYAAPLRNNLAAISAATTINELRYVLNHNRYHTVNAESFARHRTIEFRQHGGTTDYDKIQNWVNFCGKLVIWSKKNRLTAPITSIDEVPFLTASEKNFFKKRIQHFA